MIGDERSAEPRSELGIPGEDSDRLTTAEADAAYRWASAAAADRNVLVADCGRGHGAQILLDAGAKSVVGADPDPRSVEIATRLHGERIRFLLAETAALPLADQSFDVVVCLDPPQPSFDPDAAIAELGRILAEDGVMMLSLPLAATPTETAVARTPDEGRRRELLASRFKHVEIFRRRVALAATIAPEDARERTELEQASWLTGGEGEDRTILVAASDAPLPKFGSLASLESVRDLRAQQETLAAWEQRARRAEADGSAKHWELVAAREAQRRLRMRLHKIEHRPLRVISRVLRGKPAKLGEGPPLRASEIKPEHWD